MAAGFAASGAILAGCVSMRGYEAIEREIASSDRAIAAAQAALSDRCELSAYAELAEKSGDGEIWTRAFQKALDEHEIVVVPAREEPYFIDAPLVIGSNRRIEAYGATIALKEGTDTLLLRNAGAADGTLAPAGGAGRDRNIAIAGGVWKDWRTARAGYGKSGRFDDRPREKGAFYGVSTLFYLGNADLVSVRDACFASCSGFAVQCGDGDGYLFENVSFDGCFADGLHLNGNLSRVHAKGISGKVGDDLVALNAYDWLDSSVNFGPQEYILCEDLELKLENGNGYPAIRLLPCKFRYADGSVVDCSITSAIFRRVRGIMAFKMYLQTAPYLFGSDPEWSGVGTGGDLHFEDIEIDLAGPIDRLGEYVSHDPDRGHFGAFEFGADLADVNFKNIDIVFHADEWPLSHLATVGPKSALWRDAEGKAIGEIFDPYASCSVGKVTIEGLRARGTVPAELVHAVEFDDIDGDGKSSGRGSIGMVSVK